MSRTSHLIIFDGGCNLCNGVVGWLMKRGMADRFRFVPFRSTEGQKWLNSLGMPQDRLDTVILIDPKGVHTLSDGFLQILSDVPGWSNAAYLLGLVPRSLRNAIYMHASRNRVRMFGQAESCVITY